MNKHHIIKQVKDLDCKVLDFEHEVGFFREVVKLEACSQDKEYSWCVVDIRIIEEWFFFKPTTLKVKLWFRYHEPKFEVKECQDYYEVYDFIASIFANIEHGGYSKDEERP